jgi:hypothetical protein
VGHKPEPVALVRRSNVGSSQHCPSTVIPERGQVTKNDSESSSNECWTVFHEDVSGSNLANDPRHVSPHSAALACDACAISGNADVLARKAARYDINNSSPRSAVKTLNVIPNRERREKAVILSGGKYASCVGFPFDGTDRSPSEQLSGKYSATSPGKERKLSQCLIIASEISQLTPPSP